MERGEEQGLSYTPAANSIRTFTGSDMRFLASHRPVWVGSSRRHSIGIGMVVLVVFLFTTADGCSSSSSSSNNGNSAGSTATCSPTPCGSTGDFIVYVSGVDRNAKPKDEFTKPEAGNHFVKIAVKFHSDSSDEQHANPVEFVLKDATGVKHDMDFTGPCDSWQAVNLTKGSDFGPKDICFQAAGDPNQALTLVWTPGLFGKDINIPLQ